MDSISVGKKVDRVICSLDQRRRFRQRRKIQAKEEVEGRGGERGQRRITESEKKVANDASSG